MTSTIRNLHALWIIVYCVIITVAFGLQIFEHEEPCPLCYLQRIAMLLVCLAAAMNLVFGIRTYHYALVIVASLFGGGTAIRQILLHICPGFTQFGIPFWGLSLYTWSFLTFVGSLTATAIFLALYREDQRQKIELNLFEQIAIGWFALVVCGNIVSSLIDCGLGACRG
ncbi:MAG: disulfide bond formation protein B [Chlamydiales bacterium]|nr:disulfide bond formation protein B [Chlamydiia bacterium]MCP5506834.1 disulfide bond formation protein B [Chlamydiales bacterium]